MDYGVYVYKHKPSLCQSFHFFYCHSKDEHVVLTHLFKHLNIGTIQGTNC